MNIGYGINRTFANFAFTAHGLIENDSFKYRLGFLLVLLVFHNLSIDVDEDDKTADSKCGDNMLSNKINISNVKLRFSRAERKKN